MIQKPSKFPLIQYALQNKRAMIIIPRVLFLSASISLAPNQSGANDFSNAVRNDISAQDLVRVKKVTRPARQFETPEKFESRSGGAGTSFKLINANSFSHPTTNITFEERSDFSLGNALFRKLWTSSPSSTQASDGLGPLFNARACQSCHLKDGRGRPPEKGELATSMFLRLARQPATREEEKLLASGKVLNFPDPIYGGQLQNFAVPQLVAEGQLRVNYVEQAIVLSSNETASLRRPEYRITDLGYGPLHLDTTISPRLTPQMIGMGLIQAIHPADIIALADPRDNNNDGISGKAARVYDNNIKKFALGRFGWKAQNPTIRAQSVGAFSGDIGISTPPMPNNFGDCTQNQAACLEMPTGEQSHLGPTEAPSPILDLVTFYSENLAVPARRNVDNTKVLEGKQVFYNLGCTACHNPKFVTRKDAETKAHSFQLIWPYSDFLLHDMGEGLADGQQVGVASGREWRTPPLWGIGLTKTVSGHTFFLHDGRARNLTEAILWHGGEAKKSRNDFASLPELSRNALLKFLNSL